MLCLFAIASWNAAHSKDEVLKVLRQKMDVAEVKLQKAQDWQNQQLAAAALTRRGHSRPCCTVPSQP